jgi:hypothetical protein
MDVENLLVKAADAEAPQPAITPFPGVSDSGMLLS